MTSIAQWQQVKQAFGPGLVNRAVGAANKVIGRLRGSAPTGAPGVPLPHTPAPPSIPPVRLPPPSLPAPTVRPPVAAPKPTGSGYWNYEGVGAAAPPQRVTLDKLLNSKALMGVGMGTMAATGVQTGVQNYYEHRKRDAMLENGIRDHFSGLSQGIGETLGSLRDMPFLERVALMLNPNMHTYSDRIADKLQKRFAEAGPRAQAYAPGVIHNVLQRLQPGYKPSPEDPSVQDATYGIISQARQQLQQEADRLERLRQGVTATTTTPL